MTSNNSENNNSENPPKRGRGRPRLTESERQERQLSRKKNNRRLKKKQKIEGKKSTETIFNEGFNGLAQGKSEVNEILEDLKLIEDPLLIDGSIVQYKTATPEDILNCFFDQSAELSDKIYFIEMERDILVNHKIKLADCQRTLIKLRSETKLKRSKTQDELFSYELKMVEGKRYFFSYSEVELQQRISSCKYQVLDLNDDLSELERSLAQVTVIMLDKETSATSLDEMAYVYRKLRSDLGENFRMIRDQIRLNDQKINAREILEHFKNSIIEVNKTNETYRLKLLKQRSNSLKKFNQFTEMKENLERSLTTENSDFVSFEISKLFNRLFSENADE
jgi:hypothetical protein